MVEETEWAVEKMYPYQCGVIVGDRMYFPRTAAMDAWQKELCDECGTRPDNKQTFVLNVDSEKPLVVQFWDFAVYMGREHKQTGGG